MVVCVVTCYVKCYFLIHFIFVVKELDEGKVPVEVLQKRDLSSFEEVLYFIAPSFVNLILICLRCFCCAFVRLAELSVDGKCKRWYLSLKSFSSYVV